MALFALVKVPPALATEVMTLLQRDEATAMAAVASQEALDLLNEKREKAELTANAAKAGVALADYKQFQKTIESRVAQAVTPQQTNPEGNCQCFVEDWMPRKERPRCMTMKHWSCWPLACARRSTFCNGC
jgi:hypothetical protein